MKFDRIVELKKQMAQANLERAESELENMIKLGERINVTELAIRTGLSRSYFHRNKHVHQLIEQARLQQEHILKSHSGVLHIPEDVEERMINLKIENMKLKRENDDLRRKMRDIGYEI